MKLHNTTAALEIYKYQFGEAQKASVDQSKFPVEMLTAVLKKQLKAS